MFSLRTRLVVATVALEAVGLAGFMISGCSGDDTVAGDGGPDGTADVSKPDVSQDINVADVKAEGGKDAGDGGSDAAPPGLTFALQEALTFCEKFLGCCPGGLDGGAYSLAQCEGNLAAYGWEGTLPPDLSVYTRGHTTFNADAGAACLAAIQTMPCGAQTASQWGPITQACQRVVQGTIPSNTGGCVSSWECAPNNYCDTTVDGGVCTHVATQGQPCNTKITDRPDEMCSYLGSTQSGLFCDLINNDGGQPTCKAAMANGGNCVNPNSPFYYSDQACTSLLCGDNLQCGGATSYPYASFCDIYTIKDAGGGG